MTKKKGESTLRTARKVLRELKKLYPDAGCSLDFGAPHEILIATILSAQCTDLQVNKVTPELFRTFRTPKAFADAPIEKLEELVKSTGFYHNKAKNIQGACKKIVEEFGGEVPSTMDQLVSLPGVGRKTANCVLSNGFGIHRGVVVDTHVFRLSHRLGLSEAKTPEKVELELVGLFPNEDWGFLSHALIQLGRGPCKARKPTCGICSLESFCPKIGVEPSGNE